ncbi:MAG: hypothetical protein WBG90_19260 [Saonia sp.]
MRKISLILVATMLLSNSNLFANDFKKDKQNKSKSLSMQIEALLKNNSFDIGYMDLTASVKFMVNDKKEIVVVSVETDNEIFEGFVKSRLNYRKVDVSEYQEGKMYRVPVRITT